MDGSAKRNRVLTREIAKKEQISLIERIKVKYTTSCAPKNAMLRVTFNFPLRIAIFNDGMQVAIDIKTFLSFLRCIKKYNIFLIKKHVLINISNRADYFDTQNVCYDAVDVQLTKSRICLIKIWIRARLNDILYKKRVIVLKKYNIHCTLKIARKYHIDTSNWGRAINQLHGYIRVIYRRRISHFVKMDIF